MKHVDLQDAFVGQVHNPEVPLRIGLFLIGRQPIPAHGLIFATAPDVVNSPEAAQRVRVPLVSRTPKPVNRHGIVLWDALAVGVHEPEVRLRLGIPSLGSRTKLFESFLLSEDRRTKCCNENRDLDETCIASGHRRAPTTTTNGEMARLARGGGRLNGDEGYEFTRVCSATSS